MPYGIVTPCKTCRTVNAETGKAEKNNRSCIPIYHKSYLGVQNNHQLYANWINPNPIENECLIRTTSDQARVEVLNCTGQTVQLPETRSSDGIRLSFNGLPSGLYYVILSEGGKRSVVKAVKL